MPDAFEALQTRTLRQRIGGRWAISWQAFGITAVLGLLALLAGEQQAVTSLPILLRWLLLYVIAMGATGVLILVVNYTAFRHRRERPIALWLVVIFHGSCGAFYSIIVSLGAQWLGLAPEVTLLERTVLNAIYAMWWGPTLSYFLDLRQQSRQARRQIAAEAVDVELTQAQQDELTRRMREELIAEVNAELIPAREAIDVMQRRLNGVSAEPPSRSLDDWQAAAELLRGTAAESVRPLSRRMWLHADERHVIDRWWTIPASIVRHQPFRPLAFAVVDVLGTLAQQTRIFGLTDALVLLVAGLTLTIALMLAGNALMRRFPDQHAWIFLGTLVTLQLTVVLRTWLRENLVADSAPLSWQVTQIFATVLVVLITSAFGAWRDKEVETLLTLRNTLRREQVEAFARSMKVASIARDLAQMLHGSVQSRLIACAMLLESDASQNDNAKLNAALAQALDVLSSPLQPHQRADSMLDEIDRKVALWDGFCDFNVHVTDAAASSMAGAVVGRVVEEGITNALRHGGATRIDIEIDAEADGNVSIVMLDNGVGPQAGPPGLGAAYLDQATGRRWWLTSLEPGARLEAHVRP